MDHIRVSLNENGRLAALAQKNREVICGKVPVHRKGQVSLFLQLIHGPVAVQGSQGLLNAAQLFSVLRCGNFRGEDQSGRSVRAMKGIKKTVPVKQTAEKTEEKAVVESAADRLKFN